MQVLENKDKESYLLQYKGHKYYVNVRTSSEEEEFQKLPKPIKIDYTKMLFAPMPGKILSLSIKIGQKNWKKSKKIKKQKTKIKILKVKLNNKK